MKSNKYLEDSKIHIGLNESRILQQLSNEIGELFDSVGIFYRIFNRIKSNNSANKKLLSKRESYLKENKKLQDIFGIRVTVYFLDDLEIVMNLVKTNFTELPEAHSIDEIGKERFGPLRCNLVFRLSEKLVEMSSLFENKFVDTTFEIQFRTIYSEGWHEVEHDMRYKCKKDWENEDILNRQLNGQLAVLESCEWTMLKIFDEMVHKKYKLNAWSSFFRNILRIRFDNDSFSDEIINHLNKNKNIAKDLIKKERADLLFPISKLTTKIPLTMDTVLFILNRHLKLDTNIYVFESPLIKTILDKSFEEIL